MISILNANARAIPIADKTFQTCITSPPYWQKRDYGVAAQSGWEATPDEYVAVMVSIFREVWRALRDDGTLWLNLGDTYAGGGRGRGEKEYAGPHQSHNNGSIHLESVPVPPGMKRKDLVGIPWMVAFALRADGWYLRSDIIWDKTNGMTESVKDRPTCSHEYFFLLSKSRKYYYDYEAIQEQGTEYEILRRKRELAQGLNKSYKIASDGNGAAAHSEGGVIKNLRRRQELVATGKRNRRSVWTVSTVPYTGAHFATFPPDLIRPCILAGSRAGDWILDPFAGSGTVGQVAGEYGRSFIGLDLKMEYSQLALKRTEEISKQTVMDFE
jgi:DNA modification methylase